MASIGILFFILTVIIISSGNAGFINVKCKPESKGQFGQQSLLECVILTGKEVTEAKVRVVIWKKGDKTVLLLHNGKTMPEPGYSFAEPSWNESNMNVSLLITNTAVDHEGDYKCEVITDSGDDSSETTLRVTAKYSIPTIQSTPVKMTLNTDSVLTCESGGGYPKGQLRWFDVDNKEWTVSSKMEANLTENGLFHLSSKLSLLRGSIFSKYTCVVFNASGGKEFEATYELPSDPEKLDRFPTASKIVAPLVVIGSLITGLLMALLLYRRRSQQARRPSAAPLMSGHQEVCTHELDVEEGSDQETKYQDRLA
ncbi:selection and upkeep of intraepithelial T-cells protein 7 isoform X1 [Micropterus dolomieu]|uniref:selection and upkeep of intraepithelial T-cells protein 7 isoform X1 n=1 Tax=Micropterus dolomieu TaxID=147949 RepID=UPI001E8E4AEB|nr:selection and upkeep of intraepithelial T-cells protein 7 isoform X1 [Micropterus dolomieu]